MMPDLPNVGVERDLESFKEFFESPLFRADGLKIYPTLVIRGTGLYELWKTGRYSYLYFIVRDSIGHYFSLDFWFLSGLTGSNYYSYWLLQV